MWRKGNHYALLMVMQIGRATNENPAKVLQKNKTRSTIQSRDLTSEYLPKENKNNSYICIPMLIVSFTISILWKLSISRQVDKEDVCI